MSYEQSWFCLLPTCPLNFLLFSGVLMCMCTFEWHFVCCNVCKRWAVERAVAGQSSLLVMPTGALCLPTFIVLVPLNNSNAPKNLAYVYSFLDTIRSLNMNALNTFTKYSEYVIDIATIYSVENNNVDYNVVRRFF